MWQNYFSQMLNQSFETAKSVDHNLSLRSYAKQLDLSPGVLSELLRGTRRISKGRAMEIVAKPVFPSDFVNQLKKIMEDQSAEPSGPLPDPALNLILNSLNYRILCALEILPVPASAAKISEFLEIPLENVTDILQSLQKLDVVTLEDEKIFWNGKYPTTSEDVPSEKIRSFHRENLLEACAYLDLPVEEREFTTITFAANDEALAEAKQQIRHFRGLVSEGMRQSKPNKIFQLSIQLRPVSKTWSAP